jgi:PKD repeat protein
MVFRTLSNQKGVKGMNKSKGVKVTSQLVGLLLCMILIQTSFATENQNQFIVNFPNNSTLEDETVDNSTIENVTIENPPIDVLGNFTIVDYSDNDTIVDPSYLHTYLTAGDSAQFSVSFTNNGNENLVITPKVIATAEMDSLDESWITISPANATVAPGSVQYFTIEENIPWDASGGSYYGKIAFTDDITPNTEGYDTDTQYVNQMYLYIYVYSQPKIELQTSNILDDIEAGTENEYEIKVKNVATRDITIDPTLITNEYYTYYEQAFGNDAIEISAPSTVKAGEIANMSIRVHVPENATGYYNGYINMNVDGKANDLYTPGVNLHFNVWQPQAPFVKTFYTTTDDPIIIEVSGDIYRSDNELRVSQEKDKLPFELGMTHNSNPVNMIFVNSSESGSADVRENYNYPTWANPNKKTYQNVRDHYTATYIVPRAIGEWDLSILPIGANNFQYSIKIASDNLEKTWNVTNENLVPGNSSTGNASDENTTDGEEQEVLIADFSTNVTGGYAPLTVQFTDNSALNENQSLTAPTLSGEGQTNAVDEPANSISDSQETSEDDYLYGIANVESIQVMTLESFPVQVQVVAEGYLPNGCPKIDEITAEREGNTFNIKISTKSPKDAMCTQAIVPFSKTIPLDVQGLKAGNYTVNVNGVPGSFELAVDNKLDESSSDIPPRQQVITEADNGTSISLKKGENFTLKLRENPTTGYSWELYLSEGLSIISDEYTQDPAPEGYTGVPGTHSWIIEAVGQGNQQVNGIYKRPWERTTGTEDNFTLDVTSISSNTISRIWDFGDGSTSTEQNPVHTFTTAGTYNVSLVASNENETATKTAAITVLEQTLPPLANFNSNVTEGYAPLSVQFIDLSENATEWNWDFGDQTYSTEKDPVHRYCKSGKYTVKLTVKNENGMDTEKRPKYISVPRRK